VAREAQSIAAQSTEAGSPNASGIVDMVREVSRTRGVEQEAVLKMIRSYQELTGTIPKTADELQNLAKNAKISGTSLETQGQLTGTLINALGGKDEASSTDVDALNRFLIQSGRMGAVELKNFADLLPRISALAGSFNPTEEGIKRAQQLRGTEGKEATAADRKFAQLIESASAVQIARAGTAGTARDAVNTFQAIVQQVKTPRNADKLKKQFGIDVFEEGEGGRKSQRNPFELIAEAAVKSNFNEEKVSKMFGGVNVQRYVKNFRDIYTKAYDGTDGDEKTKAQAGVDAMQKELKRYFGADLSGMQRDNQLVELESTEAEQLAKKREEMRQSMEEIGSRLLAAFKPLLPYLEHFASIMPGIIDSIAANPGTAVIAAFAAVLGKAAVEQAVVAGVAKLFSGSAPAVASSVISSLTPGLGAIVAALGPYALAIGAAALAVGAVVAAIPKPELGKNEWWEYGLTDGESMIDQTTLPVDGTPAAKNKSSRGKAASSPYGRNLAGFEETLSGWGSPANWVEQSSARYLDGGAATPQASNAATPEENASALSRALQNTVLNVRVNAPLRAPGAGVDSGTDGTGQ
jgi:hypothetical protein